MTGWALAALALLLELRPVRLPEGGQVSLAPAAALAAFLEGGPLPGAAALLPMLAHWRTWPREALPALAGGLASYGLPEARMWVAVLVAAPLALVLRGPLVLARVLLAPAGAVLAALPAPVLPLAALVLLGWREALQDAFPPEERVERRRLGVRVRQLEDQSSHARAAREQSRRELGLVFDAYQSLETLARLVTRGAGQSEALQTVLNLTLAIAPEARNVAVFLGEEVAHRGDRAAEVESMRLLDLREPLLEASELPAYRARGGTLFPDDPAGAAFPLGGLGALYVGAQLNDEQKRLLGVLGVQAGLALRAVQRLEESQRSLELHAAANRALNEQARAFEELLESARQLAASAEVVRVLQESLQELIPHDWGVLWGEASWGDAPDVGPVVEALGDKPLLLPSLAESRFGGEGSLVAAGSLVLGSRSTNAFGRKHAFILQLMAMQAEAALERARLQSQLIQSGKLAAVGQLAAGVAHEINTPLTAISLAVEAAAEKPELAASKLPRIARGIERVREITDKLLYYARDARGGRKPTSLNEVVRDTLDLVGQPLGVPVELELGEVEPVEANQNELQQILTNLLVNARDAGARRIVVRTEGRVLEVEDDGSGMSEEVRSRAFEPFFTTRPVGQGTGLGLAISQQIARAHGGELSLWSDPGEGTRVRLTLPA